MKIEYKPNPLETIIELDEYEKRELWYKIRHEEMVERLFEIHYQLKHNEKGLDLERMVKQADPDYYLSDEKTPLDKRCDELLEHYIEELKGAHGGDCTCMPCSCSKCHAESMIGINTLENSPGSHERYHIASAFSCWNPETKEHDRPEVTLDEALEKLRTYNPQPVKGLEEHADRWSREAKNAYAYLLNHKNTYFGE